MGFVSAFDEFLDQVIVLPPGEWDPNIRLAPPTKVPAKEERLERIETTRASNHASSPKKEELHSEGHGDNPALMFTGRFCGGLIDDLKRKLPFYISDFRDGLNFQCLSSIMFMYFACLSPIITFGGLLGTATDFNMVRNRDLLNSLNSQIQY